MVSQPKLEKNQNALSTKKKREIPWGRGKPGKNEKRRRKQKNEKKTESGDLDYKTKSVAQRGVRSV